MADRMVYIRRAYNLLTLGLPIGLMAAGATALMAAGANDQTRRRLGLGALSMASLLVGARVYATHIEPWRLLVRRVRLASPKLRGPLRLLHMTDLELPAVGLHERRAIDRVRQLAPDLVISTGDLMRTVMPANLHTELPKLLNLLATINPPLGKLHVRGDARDKPPACELARGGGLETLEGEARHIFFDGGRLSILGLTLKESAGGHGARERARHWLDETDPEEFTILAGHRPDYIMELSDLPIDLCLAGHTHGGQVRIPFYGAPLTNSRVPRHLARGFHKVGRTYLNVSAGIGSERGHGIPPLRLFCPPEMTLLELVPAGLE